MSQELQAARLVESLHKRADELHGKLATINGLLEEIGRKFEALPNVDDLNEMTAAMPSASTLEAFADAWRSDNMPSTDDLLEFSRAMPSASDLDSFIETWNSSELPTIDELKEYAGAASQIAAG